MCKAAERKAAKSKKKNQKRKEKKEQLKLEAGRVGPNLDINADQARDEVVPACASGS